MNKWDKRFFNICVEFSSWSTCLSRQIGAVIVKDNNIVSTGFNGPPRGVTHCGESRLLIDPQFKETYIPPNQRNECPRKALGFISGEALHLCPAVHAETNAIINAGRNGVSTVGAKIYMNCGVPCRECLKLIINAGIIEIICINIDNWYDEASKYLIRESGILIRNYSGDEVN